MSWLIDNIEYFTNKAQVAVKYNSNRTSNNEVKELTVQDKLMIKNKGMQINKTLGSFLYKLVALPVDTLGYYRSVMERATNFEQWSCSASVLDQKEGNEEWKNDPNSDEYDYELIHHQLTQLRKAKADHDYQTIIYLLRTSLSRNFGGIGNQQLYAHSHIGTKKLIETYINEVMIVLNMLADVDEDVIDIKAKYDFFLNSRQALGRTALLLSGGSTLGISHLGIWRALSQNKLLPRIISGASSGSIIAAIICTRNDEELDKMQTEGDVKMDAFEDFTQEGVVYSMISRFLKTGILFNTEIMVEAMKELIGNITFQEAYNKTRRILNIPVSSSTSYEVPKLLNYVTAPNVLIWSAVAASCSVPLIFASNPIYAKDKDGNQVPWNPTGARWIDGSVENDLPMKKLTEMFNVNHFIVCQVNPHVIPFLKKEPSTSRLARWADTALYFSRNELQHWLHQLSEVGIMRGAVHMIQGVLSQPYVGDITIVPDLSITDLIHLFTNPSREKVFEAAYKGEKAIWPKLSLIRNHCAIELCIDEVIYRLRLQIFASSYTPKLSIENGDFEDDSVRAILPRSASSSKFMDMKKFQLSELRELEPQFESKPANNHLN